MLLHPRIVADPNQRLTPLWCDDCVIDSDDMQRRGGDRVKVAVGFVATDETADADAV